MNRLFICLCALAGLSGCQKSESKVKVSYLPIEESPFAPDHEIKYVLYPGDMLLFRFPSDPTLDQQVRIRSDGMISLPYVGDVQAAKRAPSELAADLNKRYEGVLKKPEVAVIVSEETGRPVYLGGQIRTPGALSLDPGQTLAQAIFEAGGLLGTSQSEVLILRAQAGEGTFVLKADVNRILAGKEPDVALQPFDVVYVPETAIAAVDRFVEQYINAIIPRAASFPFITELANQPVRVSSNNAAAFPVQIRR